MLKFLPFVAALATVLPPLACQPRVVLVSFNAGPNLSPDVDHMWVQGIDPVKPEKELTGFQVIGYYGVKKPQIIVRVTACVGNEMVAYQQGPYDVMDDEVTIRIDPGINGIDPTQDTPHSCSNGLARIDGGSNEADTGGGTGGSGAGGDMAGGAGGSAMGGSGIGGAGIGGASGTDGGVTDSGECGTDTHAPVCDPPSGDAGAGDSPDPPTISPDCIQYCSNIQSKCGGVYDSDDACQRYCALAGWAPTGTNTLACRNVFLTPAAPPSSYCVAAGPNSAGNCGGACPNFCAAWIGICHHDPSEMSACVNACMMKVTATNGAEPACRFQLLQRALYDTRYCDYVKFGSCFSCE